MTQTHADRLAAHRQRIAKEAPIAEQAEREEAARQRRITKRLAAVAAKKHAKRAAVPYLACWLNKIDRLDAMAANPGWTV